MFHALAPSIINWNLWKMVHLEAWSKQETHIDPRTLCWSIFY
jgi:hypothetical protein